MTTTKKPKPKKPYQPRLQVYDTDAYKACVKLAKAKGWSESQAAAHYINAAVKAGIK